MNMQARSLEGDTAAARGQFNDVEQGGSWELARAEAFGPRKSQTEKAPPAARSEMSESDARAEFQKDMENLIEEATSIGPVKRKQGYYQVLKEKHKDWSDEKASAEAHRIKKFNQSKDVLRVGEMLPTTSAERRKEILGNLMKAYDDEVARNTKAIEDAKAAKEAQAAEEKKAAESKALEEAKAAQEKEAADAKAAEEAKAAQEREAAYTKAAEEARAAQEKESADARAAEEAKAAQEREAAESKFPKIDLPEKNSIVGKDSESNPAIENESKEASPDPSKTDSNSKAAEEKECGSLAELGRNITGGALLGGTVGILVEVVGVVPGAIVGAAGGAYIWNKERQECEAEKLKQKQ